MEVDEDSFKAKSWKEVDAGRDRATPTSSSHVHESTASHVHVYIMHDDDEPRTPKER